MKEYLIFCTFCILSMIHYVFSVPDEYCLQPLNRSDCNMEPTAVFSYYKPGSRCEIQMWRGCPTFNKFDNEFQCSDLCIGRFNRGISEDNIIDLDNSDTCNKPINTEKCTEEELTVYTYDHNSCIPATWRGCLSENKFIDKALCEKTCVKDNDGDWVKELEALPDADISDINNILDNFDKNDTNNEIIKLKNVVEITTPVVTETVSITIKTETTTLGTNTSEITTLGTNTSEITTLGTITTDITTLGTNTSEITTLGNNKSEITTTTEEATTIDDFQEVVLTKRDGKGPQ